MDIRESGVQAGLVHAGSDEGVVPSESGMHDAYALDPANSDFGLDFFDDFVEDDIFAWADSIDLDSDPLKEFYPDLYDNNYPKGDGPQSGSPHLDGSKCDNPHDEYATQSISATHIKESKDHGALATGLTAGLAVGLAPGLAAGLVAGLAAGSAAGSQGYDPAFFDEVSGLILDSLPVDQIKDLSDEDLTATVVGVEQLSRVLGGIQLGLAQQAQVRTVARPNDESLALRHGCRNATEYLQRTSLISARVATQRIRLGREVSPEISITGSKLPPRFEHVAGALENGDLSVETASQITATLSSARSASPSQVDYAERCLVESATGNSLHTGNDVSFPHHADAMRVMCKAWGNFLDQDGNPPSEHEIIRKRGLDMGNEKDGLVPLSGNLLPETAALLARMIDAINSPRSQKSDEGGDVIADKAATSTNFAATSTNSAVTSSDNVAGDIAARSDLRSPRHKRHDAFATILNVAAQSEGIPTLGGAPVTVLIQTTMEDITSPRGGTAWLNDHQGQMAPISMSAVHHGACSGTVQFFAQNRMGKITALSTPNRVFTARQRQVITVRDGGCVIPGCTVPASWCEIHHVTPHSEGGPTHTDNGTLLCWYHHRNLESSGWEIRMLNGFPQVRAPRWLDSDRKWRTSRPVHKTPGRPPDDTG